MIRKPCHLMYILAENPDPRNSKGKLNNPALPKKYLTSYRKSIIIIISFSKILT